MTASIRISAIAAYFLLTSTTYAATLNCEGLSRPFENCPQLNPATGHYYARVVEEPGEIITWDEAREGAASFTFQGFQGHLATITSQEENDFLNSTTRFLGEGLWIGASDRDAEGEWKWVVGPEAGELFWSGGPDGTANGFSNWNTGEPNDSINSPGGEDYAVFGNGLERGWNDLANDSNGFAEGYVVEFSVPEPSACAIAAISLIGLAGLIRRSNRRAD